MPWQYAQRLGMHISFSYHYLALGLLVVSEEAWQAILYLNTPWQFQLMPWQYPSKDQPPKIQATKGLVKRINPDCEGPRLQAPKTKLQKLKVNKQRHAAMLE